MDLTFHTLEGRFNYCLSENDFNVFSMIKVVTYLFSQQFMSQKWGKENPCLIMIKHIY